MMIFACHVKLFGGVLHVSLWILLENPLANGATKKVSFPIVLNNHLRFLTIDFLPAHRVGKMHFNLLV